MGRVTRFMKASTQTTAEMPRPKKDLLERTDQDLQRVIANWPALPRHIRTAILALVASGGGRSA